MPVDKKILEEYIATANSGKYSSLSEVNSKFPELKDYDNKLLEEYIATANSGKYSSLDEVNSKFPEFFTPKKKDLTWSQDFGKAYESMPQGLPSGTKSPTTPSASTSPKKESSVADKVLSGIDNMHPFAGAMLSRNKASAPELKAEERFANYTKAIQNINGRIEKSTVAADQLVKQYEALGAEMNQLNQIISSKLTPQAEKTKAALRGKQIEAQGEQIKSQIEGLKSNYEVDVNRKNFLFKAAIDQKAIIDNKINDDFSFAKHIGMSAFGLIIKSAGSAVEGFGDLTEMARTQRSTDEKITDKIGTDLAKIGSAIYDEAQSRVPEAAQWSPEMGLKELTPFKTAVFASNAIASIVPSVLAALSGSKAATVTTSAMMNFGDAYDVAKQRGFDDDKAALVAAAITPLVTMLDQLGLDQILKANKNAFSQFVKSETLKRLAGKELSKDVIFAVSKEVFTEGLKRFGKTAGKIVLTEVPTEAAQGALQEAGIQLADKQEIDWAKLGYATEAEALGGFFGAGAMSLGASYKAMRFNPTAYGVAMGTKNAEFAADLQEMIAQEVKTGNLTEEQAQEVTQNIKTIVETDAIIPSTVTNPDARIDAINLVGEKNALMQEMEGMEPAMVLDKKERIKQIEAELTFVSKSNFPVPQINDNSMYSIAYADEASVPKEFKDRAKKTGNNAQINGRSIENYSVEVNGVELKNMLYAGTLAGNKVVEIPNAQTTNTEATTGAGQTNDGPGGTGSTGGTTTATDAGQTPGVNSEDIRSQAEQQREQVRKDMEIEAFQERTGFPLYDPFEQMPDMVQVTLGRVADGDTVDPVQVKEASDWLYTEYKRLDAMKVADNRTMTIPQIEEIQAEIEGEITLLENEYNQVEQQNQERAAVGESNQQTEGAAATETGTEVNGASTETIETGEAATTEGQEAPVTQEEGTGPAQETARTEDKNKLDDDVVAEAEKRGITAPHALRILDKYTPNWRTKDDKLGIFQAAIRIRAAQKGEASQAKKWSLLAKNPKLFLATRMINRTFGMLGVKTLILNDSDFNAIFDSISGKPDSGRLRFATFDPVTKTMYLRSSNIAQTAFHEIAHPFLDSLRLLDRNAYDAIVERVKSLDIVKPDTRGQSYFEWAKTNYSERGQSVIDNEAVAEFLADTLSGGVGVSDMLKAEAMQVVNDILKAFGYKGTINKPVTLKFIAENIPNFETIVTQAVANSMILEGEAAEVEEQEMRDQMIHQKAQLNEDVRYNLRKARRMEELGVSKDIIWMATGWERGANNKWGYEIPDLKVKKKYSDIESLVPSTYGEGHMLGDVINAPDLFKAYPDLKNIEIAYDDNEYDVTASYEPNGDVIRLGVLAAIDLNSAIAHEVQHAIQKRENFGLAGREEIEEVANSIPGIDIISPYSDVADNSLELVEDVIDDARRDYKTVQDVLNDKRYSRENFFELLRDFLSKEYSIDIPVMKSVDRIIIDNKNYFAGNDIAEASVDALVSDMQERIDNINSDEESDESDIEFANRLKSRIEFVKNNPDKVEFVYKDEPVSSISKEMLKNVSNSNSSMDMDQLLDEMLDYYSGKVSDKYDVYEKAQPEVEARNVQTRMKMSKKERAVTPPSRTEDVERDSQIFFGDTMRDQMIPRETLENNQVATALEQEAIIAAADYMQNSINMDAKAAEYAAKSDDVIESDISKPVSITDENSEVVFAFMEAIRRAEVAPDRKFRGKTIPEILIPLSKIATFSGKVMRFMRMLPKFSTKAQSEAMFALIENNGYKLSPAQKTMLSEKIGAARLAVQAVEAAKTAYLNTGTEAARKLMEAERRKQEKVDRDLADTLLPMLPADYLDRFISNMQGNIQATPSLIANLTSGMEAYPRTLLETTARGIFDFVIGSATGRPKGSAWATLAGFNPFWRGVRSIPSEMIKTLLYGSDVQLDGSARQYGSRVSAKAMYNAMTNPNMKMRVPGGKVFEVFETKDEIQVREVLSDVKGNLIATYPDPRVAAVEAGKIHGAKAFGNEVWQMKKTERGPIHSSYQKPVVPNQALLDTLLGQAEDEAYMLSTKPDTGHQFYFITSQIAGITAEALNRVSTLTDNAVRNPLQMARLTEEARRHGMSVDSLVAYAALDETGEFSKHLEYLAKSATYQQDNKVATWISKGEAKMKNWIKGRDNNATRVVAAVLFIMAKSQLLFTKTPLNVLNRMVDVILQGIPSATQSAIYFKDSYLAAQKGDRVKADLYYSKGVNYFAKGVSAFVFNTAAAFILAIPGAVIAGYDSLDDKRKAALEAQRVPPGSINVSAVERSINGESPEWQKGDKILPLRYFGQLGQAILFRANVKTRADVKTEKDASSGNAEAVQDELLTEKLNIISAVPKQAFEFSSMAGVNTLINTINADKGSKWAQWSRGMTQSILAGFGVPATYSKAMEEELKQELVDPNSMKNTVMNVGMYRLGIPNPDVFARVDALGFPVRNTAKGNNPLAKADYAPDPLWEKLIKIKEETKDPRVIPSSFRVGTEKVTDMLDIETYELLAKDTDILNRMRGAYRVTELEKLFNDKTYELTNGKVGSVFDEPDLEVKARMVINAIREADNMFKPEYKKYLVELSRKAGYPKLEQLEQMLIDDNAEL